MRSYVQFLTTPTADTPGTTLLLYFDNKRYLIGNLSEGTQRASVQVGAKLLRVSECFLTGRSEWSNTGGMLGMVLTLADSAAAKKESNLEEALGKARSKAKRLGISDDLGKVNELENEAKMQIQSHALSIFGPPNLNHTFATARRFIFRKGMPVNAHEIREAGPAEAVDADHSPYWADENIKVWAMSIKPDGTTNSHGVNGNGAVSSRKRSINEMRGDETSATENLTEDDLTREERDQLTVKAIVSEMFDSSWRLDTLFERPLSQVRLPASIFIRNPETNKIERYQGPLPGSGAPVPDPEIKVLVRQPWPGALVESLPPTQPAKEAISYIIRNHTQRGKFNPARAKELNVEKGPKWAQLANGFDVVNEDGESITPDMVLGESKEGRGFAVVDIPDASYIDNLISRAEWTEPKIMTNVGAIIWICGEGVATDSRVHEFMRKFSQVEHIVSSKDYCSDHVTMNSCAGSTIRLRQIDPARYGIPVHESLNDADGSRGSSQPKQPLPSENVRSAMRGQVIQLEPTFELQDMLVGTPFSVSDVENEVSQDVLDEALAAQKAIESSKEEELRWAAALPEKDAEIVTLGTGSALPSKYRNVSATLVRVPNWGSMLLDCGENTLGQLKRVFAPQELKQILQELKAIFISHMHADHHLGTVSVIKAWYEEVHGARPAPPITSDYFAQSISEDRRRLAVISEPAMLHWLAEYSDVEDYGFSRIDPLNVTVPGRINGHRSELQWFIPPSELAELTPEARKEKYIRNTMPVSLLGLKDLQAVAVQHCHGARAFAITFPSGFKVSYSGDCRPSKAFARIGRGSTVCIHEATFDDELQVDAEAKNHSTTSEALGVAQAMRAKACILTHFSQRYQKLPVLEHTNNHEEHPDVAMSDDSDSEDLHDAENGPLDDAAPTLPGQATSNGAGGQYELPSKRPDKRRGSQSTGPAAVRLKVSSDMRVGVAFDYMRVKVGEIGQLEKFIPAQLKLFAEEDAKSERVAAENTAAAESARKTKKGKKKDGQST